VQSGVTYESLNENLKTVRFLFVWGLCYDVLFPRRTSHTTPMYYQAQYAVRGAIVLRAMELAKQMAAGEKLPFDRILYCNIGNPQSLEQKPLTFNRQVHALLECPDLMNNESVRVASRLCAGVLLSRVALTAVAVVGGRSFSLLMLWHALSTC